MKHVILCSEFPPAPVAGGIGTYTLHLSRLLAERGDTVHVIALRWPGAPRAIERRCRGRLIIHRVSLDEPVDIPRHREEPGAAASELRALKETPFAAQAFAWQAGLLTEHLVDEEAIDVIEAPDWEAPLYYFQLRRGLGIGPERHPPCIVHLHSPSEFIVRHNDWSMAWAGYLTSKRHEDYSIGAADVLLCPSRYLARQAEAHYGLGAGSVEVIPLPIGDSAILERDDDVWKHGSICYIGRLEPRKGVIEWIDAAVAVARDDPSVQFEFIGADVPYDKTRRVQSVVEERIPDSLRRRFHFRGAQSRARLTRFLAQARIAVIPSRWENFPNTCIEAMCSGLPVVASREGGMAEMIEEGVTGWLAATPTPSGLEDALRAAVATPPPVLAQMGARAAKAIRELCDNARIVERHVEFRRRVVRHGPGRSRQLPPALPGIRTGAHEESKRRAAGKPDCSGVAVIVTCLGNGRWLDDCLRSIEDQIRAPVAVVVVVSPAHEAERAAAVRAAAAGWTIREYVGGSPAAAKNLGVSAVVGAGWRPLGFAFIDTADRLTPEFVEACESVLRRRPEVGLVSSWMEDGGHTLIRPCPAFPYQLECNEAVPASLIRTEALIEAGLHREALYAPYEAWDLANAIMAAGWVAVTLPAVLSARVAPLPSPAHLISGHDRMRRLLLGRVPDIAQREAIELLLLAKTWTLESSPGFPATPGGPETLTAEQILARSVRDQFRIARWVVRHPWAALHWILGLLRKAVTARRLRPRQ
jgi:glycosyltransferase involved in cell wall biosynthesis